MALGIGLSGFAQGVEGGYELGTKIQEDVRKREQRAEMDTALSEGRADYDAAVTSGEAKANDPNAILRYSFPKMMGPLLKSGDIEGAASLSKWVKSDDARRGTELFGSAIMDLQTGNVGGAFKKINQIGKMNGYGSDFELDDPEELPGGRWRVKGRTADGHSFTKDMTAGEIADFIAATQNPEAAYRSFQDRQAKEDWRRTLRGGSYQDRLERSESGGRAGVVNDLGYAGRFQFGAPRLAEMGLYRPGEGENLSRWSKTGKGASGKWSGTFNIPGHPDVKTLDDFLASPEAQQTAFELHQDQNDAEIASRGLDRFIGTEIKGVPITRESIQAMMHLGGAKGAERFLKTGGKYNPKDANGTSLLDYARLGRGGIERRATPTRVASRDTGTMTDAGSAGISLPGFGPRAAQGDGVEVAQADTDTLSDEGGLADRFGLSQEQVDVLSQLGPEEGMKELTKYVMQKNPAAVQEYEYAVSQGYDGTLIDYELEKARASAGTEPSFDKAAGEGLYKFAEGELTAAEEARAQLRDYEQLARLLGDPNVYTGTGGATIASLKKMGKTLFGIEGLEGVGNAEAAQKIGAEMVGKLKKMLPGPMSNADRQFLQSIPPNLGDSPEGIQLTVELARETALAQSERAEKLQEIMSRDGGRLTMEGRLEFDRWAREQPLFSDELMQEIQTRAEGKTVPRGPTAGSEGAIEDLKSKYGLE